MTSPNGSGKHRAGQNRPEPARTPAAGDLVEYPPAGGVLTVDELRRFIARIEDAASCAQVSLAETGQMPVRVLIRRTGAIRMIWAQLPR